MIIWCVILTIGFAVQGAYIRSLEKEIEAIKSWYPFCEILKIKIPEKMILNKKGARYDRRNKTVRRSGNMR